MNKDVIYIEPEDDITDILAKMTAAKEKVVALVPPKKSSVLRSSVNMKLIARTAKSSEKVPVIVSSEPALTKIAAVVRIPMAKNLQSRPEIPEMENPLDKANKEQVIDEDLSKEEEYPEKPAKKPEKTEKKPEDGKKHSEKPAEHSKKDPKKKVPDIKKARKFIIAGVIAGVALIGFLVWALVFAPAAKITLKIKTTGTSFSETVNFTTADAEAKPSEGLFLLEEQKLDKDSEVEFKATGSEDRGNKASGTLSVTYTTKSLNATSITIPAGTVFTHNGLNYSTNSALTLTVNEESCTAAMLKSSGCQASSTIAITASANGDKYNISGKSSEWSTKVSGLTASNSESISGGTSRIVTVVTQADVDNAKKNLTSMTESEGKTALKDQVKEGYVAIEASFANTTSDAVATPKVGEEVADGVTPKLKQTTSFRMFSVDRTQVENYIAEKINLASDQKIYSYGEPYFERFLPNGNSYTAKLKTTVYTGPKITEEEILEKSKGQKTGEVKTQLKSINGVSDVSIETSYFWVNNIPDDPNKVTIEMTVDGEGTKDNPEGEE